MSQFLRWPPYSLDLNPIETVLKDWNQIHYGERFTTPFGRLSKNGIQFPEDFLRELIQRMPKRCQKVKMLMECIVIRVFLRLALSPSSISPFGLASIPPRLRKASSSLATRLHFYAVRGINYSVLRNTVG